MTVERFLPDVAVEPLDDVYGDLVIPAGDERPHVYLGMVASVDGSAVVDGRSAGLGSHADRAAFRRLRETCDVILVGAGTVREEDYRAPRAPDDVVRRRAARGLAPRATIVVVTRRGDLDPTARLFADPTYRPLVVAPRATELGHLAGVVEVLRCGETEVDLGEALRQLADRGYRRVLCEGGPALNGALLRADLVDELFLTLAPSLVGSTPHRIVETTLDAPRRLELVELRHSVGELLLRYRVLPLDRGAVAPPAGGGIDR